MTRRTVFVDTWGWIAGTVRRDAAHERVRKLGRELQRGGGRWVTSNCVLAEALTRLRYDESLTAALALAEVTEAMAEAEVLHVVTLNDSLWQVALTWFRRFADQRFSFVDCTYFAIMHSLGLDEALTADRHFATAGFVPLG